MPEITKEMIDAVYMAAKDVFRGNIKKTKAKKELFESHGMNENSAADYIEIFKQMMYGKQYERTIKADALDTFLTQISADYGNDALAKAIDATDKHVIYYKKHGKKFKDVVSKHKELFSSQRSSNHPIETSIETAFIEFDKGERPTNFRTPDYWYVLDRKGKAYPAKAIWSLATKLELKDFNTTDARNGLAKLEYSLVDNRAQSNDADFEKDVIDSIGDTPEARKKRLQSSAKKPRVSYRLVKTFNRNKDVIAEVLMRADGICEMCNEPAPFNRKAKNLPSFYLPYLEVHHKIQLAHHGDDTVENAIALCPNCHRKTHHG